jgi:hypothetical protein
MLYPEFLNRRKFDLLDSEYRLGPGNLLDLSKIDLIIPNDLLELHPVFPNSVPLSKFEKNLFIDGKYKFNPDRENHDTISEFMSSVGWWFQNPNYGSMGNLSKSIEKARLSLIDDYFWKKTFDGEIPKKWAQEWYEVERDLIKIKESDHKLSSRLAYAALTYPHWAATLAVADIQSLTPNLYGIALAQIKLEKWQRSYPDMLKRLVSSQSILMSSDERYNGQYIAERLAGQMETDNEHFKMPLNSVLLASQRLKIM